MSEPGPERRPSALPTWLRLRSAGVEVAVRLNPNASREGVQGAYGDRIKLGVNAPAVAGAANQSLVRFVAKAAGCPPGQVEVVVGAKSRSKTVLVRCAAPQAVADRLVAKLVAPAR